MSDPIAADHPDAAPVGAVRVAEDAATDAVALRDAAALDLLIEGEQQLLAAFDARQASADARTTATAAAAVLLPAATLTLASALGNRGVWLTAGYAMVAALAVIAVALRTWTGTRLRLAEDQAPSADADHEAFLEARAIAPRSKKFSTESFEAARAREAWWACDPQHPPDPDRVRVLALEMWRSRARHSRKLAQDKEKAAAVAAVVFACALIVSAVLVAAAYTSKKTTSTAGQLHGTPAGAIVR